MDWSYTNNKKDREKRIKLWKTGQIKCKADKIYTTTKNSSVLQPYPMYFYINNLINMMIRIFQTLPIKFSPVWISLQREAWGMSAWHLDWWYLRQNQDSLILESEPGILSHSSMACFIDEIGFEHSSLNRVLIPTGRSKTSKGQKMNLTWSYTTTSII